MDPENSTWEQITGFTGSFLQDSINFVDNAFLGTLSDWQKSQIDQANESGISQAAAGDVPLADSEISQYKGEVQSVYGPLPTGIEGLASTIIHYAPWIVGGLILIYLTPFFGRLKQ